ncbi:pinin [Neodiprion pinetum]|uniref:Pinin n=1 Tax=Neodiprion lecontei TaxID=441921 RepID=A0A6J0C8Q5_NEOLC|nr:pinin [Neodiprion lecontei]XP_046413918.1 pinin [Neodiprion fabricii]XP_046469726.1 pinin [Neodiprion pinetum]XP_046607313.1 pinin [Neodiprion virginianus]
MRKLETRESWGAEKLEAQLEAARDNLRGLDRSIQKILGRDPPDGENPLQPTARIAQKRPVQEDHRRRQVADFAVLPNNLTVFKRRWVAPPGEPKTVFSRLSARIPSNADDSADEDDNTAKPAVSSRVIATPREIPSRQEVIRRERVDERSRQRNKRMFGALLGTLQKFRQEETKLKAKEDKKAEVEARVEEAGRREKEELRRERQQLFQSRKRQQAEVRSLEAKLVRSRQFQEWRASQLPLTSFIRTRTQPSIYYLPKRKHSRTDSLLALSAKELNDEIERREKILMEELEQIEFQAGLGKQLSNESNIVSTVQEEPPTPMEEGEENRDPNHEVEQIEKEEVQSSGSPTCESKELIPLPIDSAPVEVAEVQETQEMQEMLEDANNG